jgi:hypothetical protein
LRQDGPAQGYDTPHFVELALNFVAVIKWTPAASDIDTVLDSLKLLDRNF